MHGGVLKTLLAVLVVLLLVIAGPALFSSLKEGRHERADAAATIGDPAALQAAYARWKHARLRGGKPDELVLPLHYSRGLSGRFTTARGHATLDLVSGAFAATIAGLSNRSAREVWLVDRGAVRHQREARTDMVRAG